jgi:hypothetical protein
MTTDPTDRDRAVAAVRKYYAELDRRDRIHRRYKSGRMPPEAQARLEATFIHALDAVQRLPGAELASGSLVLRVLADLDGGRYFEIMEMEGKGLAPLAPFDREERLGAKLREIV